MKLVESLREQQAAREIASELNNVKNALDEACRSAESSLAIIESMMAGRKSNTVRAVIEAIRCCSAEVGKLRRMIVDDPDLIKKGDPRP